MAAYIVASMVTGCLQERLVAIESFHQCMEVVISLYFEAATSRLQVLCLLELFVIGTEDHRHIPYGSLQYIMNTHAKAATHVGDIGKVVDARQQTEAVDDEHLGISNSLVDSIILPRRCRQVQMLLCLCISDDLPSFEFLLNLFQMVLTDDMGRNNQFPVAMRVEIANEDVFVRLPGRAGNNYLSVDLERADIRLVLGLFLDCQYAVETGITCHRHIRNTDLCQ